MKKKSEVTNEQLLEAIKDNRKLIDNNRLLINHNKEEILDAMNQFATDVENRFGGVDKRFDSVESRLSNLEFTQEDIVSKLNNAAYKIDIINLDKRLAVLENK